VEIRRYFWDVSNIEQSEPLGLRLILGPSTCTSAPKTPSVCRDPSRGFNGAQVAFNRPIRIEDDGNAIEARCDLLSNSTHLPAIEA
jgi:hypothetical protein